MREGEAVSVARKPRRLRRRAGFASGTHSPKRTNPDDKKHADAKSPREPHRGEAPKNIIKIRAYFAEYFSLISSTRPQLNLPSGHLPET